MKLKHLITASALVPVLTLSAVPFAYAQTRPVASMRTHSMVAFFRANITAINGNTLTVSKNNVTVDISNAKLDRRFGGSSNVGEFSVGDSIVVRGTWTDSSKTAVTATRVQDMSIQKFRATFTGSVTAVSDTGFTLQSNGRGSQTVQTGSSTKFVGHAGVSMSLSDIKVGDKVQARGMWDRKTNILSEVTFVRDYSFQASK